MRHVCLAVFREKDRTLVASAETDADGNFFVRGLEPGMYRLVAKGPPLGVANVPLRIETHANHDRSVLIHMKAAALDRCSYGEIIKKK